jgi:hypothetical protein
MTKQEKQELIKRLREHRDRCETPIPANVDPFTYLAGLRGRTIAVLDDALITLSG